MLAAHALISLPCVHHSPRSPASSPAFFSCFPKVFQTHLLKKIDTSPRCRCLPVAPASPSAHGVSPWFCFWRPGQLVWALMSLCQVSRPRLAPSPWLRCALLGSGRVPWPLRTHVHVAGHLPPGVPSPELDCGLAGTAPLVCSSPARCGRSLPLPIS